MVTRTRERTALVVFAHPVAGSFTSAIKDRAVAGFAAAGWVVDELDLYSESFDPRITASELRGVATDDPDLNDHSDRVTAATALVFVYPTWWGGQPAIVKGWLDRMLCSPDRARSLRSIRRLVVISPHGSSRFRNALQGVPGRRIMFRHVRSRCHRLARCTWIAMYSNDQADDSRRVEFLDEVESRTERLAASFGTPGLFTSASHRLRLRRRT